MKNEIILYQADDLTRVEVKVDEDTVWLNRQQIAVLFDRDIKTIGKHINNVFSEGELVESATVAKFATVQTEGGRQVERQIEHYNLDVIISVGYRVKSKQGTQFRIWANKVLKDHLLKGYSLNKRMNRIEENAHSLKESVDGISLQINTHPSLLKHSIFFDGQFFDAYQKVSEIIRTAEESIILIDNYIDDTVLLQLAKRKENIPVTIYTKSTTPVLPVDVQRFNAQYPPLEVIPNDTFHDRFMIIDRKTIYHIGASLKDLGNKTFALTKLELDPVDMISKLENTND